MTDARDAAEAPDRSRRADPESELSDSVDAADYDVRPDHSAVECAYCGRPFSSESLLALHRGHDHWTAITETERERFEEVYDAESGAIRRFRLKALAALVVLYFGLLMVYAVVI